MTAAGAAPHWYEENPDRLNFELEQLAAAGYIFAVDESELRRGRIVLRGQVDCEGDLRDLVLAFPDNYPDHRLEIFDQTPDQEVLPMHQEPTEGRLCLLPNVARAWTTNCNAAWMIWRVMKLRRAAQRGEEGLREIGVGAEEPWSAYYPYIADSALLVPESTLEAPGQQGPFRIKWQGPEAPARVVLASVEDADSADRTEADPRVLEVLFPGPTSRGAWFRVDSPPPVLGSVDELLAWAVSVVPGFAKYRSTAQPTKWHGEQQRVWPVAFVYRDRGPEGEHDAWLMAMINETLKAGKFIREGGFLLRPFVLGADEQLKRVAALRSLSKKHIAVIGLGTVGAPIALELARTGLPAKMTLIDPDYYAVWNVVRHPLELPYIGRWKAAALGERVRQAAPWVDVECIGFKVGNVAGPGSPEDPVPTARLAEMLGEAEMLVDASADIGVAKFLNRISLRQGIPLVVASVTEGGWGGEVVRCIPQQTGCYECYLWEVSEGKHEVSQQADAEPIFTRGCGFPSFAGAGFDALSLAADACRLVVQTLGTDAAGLYPDAAYDVLVRDNRGAVRQATWPAYRVASLAVHPSCAMH